MGHRMRMGGVLAAAVLAGTACGSSGASPVPTIGPVQTATRPASLTPPGTATPEATVQATPGGGVGARLIVLGDGVQGGMSLWLFEGPDKWTAVGSIGDATALCRSADGPVIAGKLGVETRTWADPTRTLGKVALKWPTAIPKDPIVAADKSPDGQWALATSDGTSTSYFTADTDGTVSVLSPAPAQSLTPLVAWIDGTRLLMLNTDVEQVSRFSLIDTAANSVKSIETFGGIRYFAVSGDRKWAAVATADGIYLATVADWLAGVAPQKIATIDATHVVWGLAVDAQGSGVAMLDGTASADGHVSGIREIVYSNAGGSWAKTADSAAPFTTGKSQVWVP